MKKTLLVKSALILSSAFLLFGGCSKKDGTTEDTIAALESRLNELQAEMDKNSAETVTKVVEPVQQTVTKKSSVDSFITITDPYDGDERYLYNTYDVNEVKLTFSGKVSSDCTKIRVIWAPDDPEYIQAYLEGRREKYRGVPIDDYYLKQFKPGDTTFVYNVGGKLDNLQQGSNYYRFIATFEDGNTKSYSMSYYVYCGGGAEKAKPVIYLYPTKKQTVKVSVAPEGGVTESIPEMGKEWKVTAYPDGKIVDSKKTEYPYLYWESKDSNIPVDLSRGFVVETAELENFFNEKLSFLGLNKKEIADFNEYWVPELQGSPYIFITFYSQERIDAEAPLKVSPKPDSVIRVYFDHKKLEEPIEVEPQVLVPAQRSGFAVVEWGGRRYR